MATRIRDPRLDQLRRDLATIRQGGLARQEDIARAVRVAQETVSKAKTGQLKRWTDATEAIQQHANILLGRVVLPEGVQQRMRAFLAAGGREEHLCAIIDTATDLVTGRR